MRIREYDEEEEEVNEEIDEKIDKERRLFFLQELLLKEKRVLQWERMKDIMY
jgi:hypothetical protein